MSDLVHVYAPHSEQALYGLTMLFALIFAVAGTAIACKRGRGFHITDTFTQAGSGATFPTFVLMPFAPFDQHLMETMAKSWAIVGMAGLLGAGVTLYGLWSLSVHKI